MQCCSCWTNVQCLWMCENSVRFLTCLYVNVKSLKIENPPKTLRHFERNQPSTYSIHRWKREKFNRGIRNSNKRHHKQKKRVKRGEEKHLWIFVRWANGFKINERRKRNIREAMSLLKITGWEEKLLILTPTSSVSSNTGSEWSDFHRHPTTSCGARSMRH